MEGVLYLAHAVLGLVALATSGIPNPTRARVVLACAWAGMVAGTGLALLAGSDEVWHGTRLAETPGIVAGVSAAAAWLLVAVTDRAEGRWDVAALVGAASTGLALFATNRWIVPAAMFWMCSSLALGALAFERHGGAWAWVAIALSDAAVVAAVVGSVLETEQWVVPQPLDGWPRYAALAAVVIRCGVLPRLGVWGLMGSPAVAGLPLLVGSSFALLAGLAARAEPWMAVAALLLSVLASGLSIALRRISLTLTGV